MVLQPNLVPQCTPFCVPNFKVIRLPLVFMATITLWWQEKKEETQPIFEGSYPWDDKVKIWNMRWWHWPVFPLQNCLVLSKHHRATYMWKLHIIVLGMMDCPCLPPPALAVKCYTAGGYQQLKWFTGGRLEQGDPWNRPDHIRSPDGKSMIDDPLSKSHQIWEEKYNLHLNQNKQWL